MSPNIKKRQEMNVEQEKKYRDLPLFLAISNSNTTHLLTENFQILVLQPSYSCNKFARRRKLYSNPT